MNYVSGCLPVAQGVCVCVIAKSPRVRGSRAPSGREGYISSYYMALRRVRLGCERGGETKILFVSSELYLLNPNQTINETLSSLLCVVLWHTFEESCIPQHQ